MPQKYIYLLIGAVGGYLVAKNSDNGGWFSGWFG